ncbi:hypothetical protein CRG98_022142 [Punica granatum]|uniref:TIR domain-containing protein n=1 Tax=Punica granatum TaxID=22663 RepID=A0A2I0JMI7_PUNGR|nr:hypothetical protein CRG98_022142 [Punica granatum]
MVECRNSTEQMILPIFYDVMPNEVRHQTGRDYRRAFSQRVRTYSSNILQQWGDALAEVGALKGWDLKNVANGHQGQLIKLVVTEILRELKKAHLLVTDNLVGIEDRLEAVIMLDFTSVDEGTEELKRRFLDKRVFSVLDDVDHASQLTALAAKLYWFGPGSRIIITTRNRDVLQVPQVYWTYEVVEMNKDHALQLFCKHAFRQGSPMAKLSALAKGIVDTTGGIPLALEMAVKLKVLSLQHCHYITRTPDFSRFTNLERLSFENCQRLEVIHQ